MSSYHNEFLGAKTRTVVHQPQGQQIICWTHGFPDFVIQSYLGRTLSHGIQSPPSPMFVNLLMCTLILPNWDLSILMSLYFYQVYRIDP